LRRNKTLKDKENTTEELLEEIARLKKELKKKKKYGLVWEEKKEDVVEMCKEKLPVLIEDKSKAINEAGEDAPVNILIEGDNYHALSALNYTHQGKIDVIYIDPPYNTGEKDFKYNDKFVDKDDAFKHSKWLSFMSKRLKLAKKLLRQSGIIFISIDDNEQSPLRLLSDEIFSEDNLLGTLTWINKTKPVNSGKAKYQIQQNTEYIHVYSKKKKKNFEGFDLITQGERNYSVSDGGGLYRLVDIEDSDRGRKKRDTMKFEILGIKPGVGKRWKIGFDEITNLIETNRIVVIDRKVKRKIYKIDESGFVENPFWSHLIDVDTAEDGKKELSNIIGSEHGFDTVKPNNLIMNLLQHFAKNLYILDFFAGSGTTSNAVMELNKEDDGKRKFILVTNNENDICTEVCYPRISKVIKGYKNIKGEKIKDLAGI